MSASCKFKNGRNRLRNAFCVILLLLHGVALAQSTTGGAPETPGKDRPSIAIVLGGGGARGMAHIGILKWIEENRIPVDYVVGTSMGALIGGIYALGYSPDEIDALVRQIDWEEMFSTTPPFEELSFRRREDAEQYPVKFELGWKGGLSFPVALNSGHFINLLLQRLSLPYSATERFDDLPIPFRSVAADLKTGDEVVFDRGPLWVALRSSMAIPGIFTPVEANGRLLIDGGVLNNVPADVGRGLGADIVIAVDVGTPLKEEKELGSMLGILDQTITVMMLDNVRRSMRDADLVVVPELDGFFTLDFRKTDEIIRRGLEAAEKRSTILKSFAVTPQEWESHLEKRRLRKQIGAPSVDSLRITGIDPKRSAEIAELLNRFAKGPVAANSLERHLTSIYSLGQFSSVGYQVNGPEGNQELEIRAAPKKQGPPFLRLGLDIDGSDLDNIGFSVRSRTSFFDLGIPRSEWRVDAGFGRPSFLETEYYVPTHRRWFVAPRGSASRQIEGVYRDGHRIADYLIASAGAGLDLGWGTGLKDEVRLGYDVTHIDASARIGLPTYPAIKGAYQKIRLRWRHDSLDDPVIPKRGLRSEFRVSRTFDAPDTSLPYSQAYVDASGFLPVSRRDSLFALASGGTTFSGTPSPYDQFRLGGPLNLGAFHTGEFVGSNLVFLATGVLHEIAESSLMLGGRSVVGIWYETGSAFDNRSNRDFRHAASMGIATDSFIGPLILGASWGESARFKLYFGIGKLF